MSLHQVLVARAPAPASPGNDPALALLDGLTGLEDERVLILGHGAVELMCALIRGGCQEVTELRSCDRPEPHVADLVLVPQLASVEQAAMIAGHARRALVPTGRIVLGAPGHLAVPVSRVLRLHGFSGLRRRDGAGGSVLSACLPAFSLAARA
ncbi:MAG: hypothetical protein P4L71_14760 [Acetobacteraceae bacterium]|nr:hypothetical protein [Acetobacteraceae bacterium]